MSRLWGNSISFRAYPVEDACRRMAGLGYTGVEMWKDHLAGFKTSELLGQFRTFVEGLGLELFGLNAVGAAYFTPLEGKEGFARTLAGLKADVDFAIALGVKDVMVWEGMPPAVGGMSPNAALETTVALFQEATAYAVPKGVRFLAEPHPFTLGMDLDFAIELTDRLDPVNFGLLYDCCHFGVGRPDGYVEAIRVLGPRIHHVHFSDSDLQSSELHFPPGRGRMDLDAVVAALKAVGFRGTITMDLYGYPLPEEATRISLPRLREVVSQLGV